MSSSLLDRLPSEARDQLKKKGRPKWTTPMLATLTDRRFSDDQWIYERKLDGERCLAFGDNAGVRLMSRNKQELNNTYPDITETLQDQQAGDFIVDGEIVAFQGKVTSFSRLQERMHIEDPDEARAQRLTVYYYLFDLLYLDGHDVTKVALRHRKGLLRESFSYEDPLRFTPHRNASGEAYYRDACNKGWEGLIAKDAGSSYEHSRSKKWLKFKCVNRQEMVIGGYTDPEGERIGFGALLLGYCAEKDFCFAGKVGTGFDDDTLESLSSRLKSRQRKTAPFDRGEISEKGVHWVTPELVAEIGFTEWTEDGKLRHPRFLGLRRDKDARDVTREEPEA